ncbi:MAG: porphobilinogen synthase, partial [[Mycobacterium] stephanolepidis]
MSFPYQRPRRLRATPAIRRLVAETTLAPRQLVLPMFVADGVAESRPIASMPGVVQHSIESLRRAAEDAVKAGVGG